MNETEKRTYSEEEKTMAACALNLCTVSVSQILDYDDRNIMEQEYDAILNNLNLEQFPDNRAYLDVLKHILNTITFFKLNDGDRQMLVREYQFRMKNAIWSAVPSFGLIFSGGNVASGLASVAIQAGIAYMNYRREKARIQLEREKEEWKLQKSCYEQLNGLRRELFDTAWTVAHEYGFSDQLRLTENQCTMFDQILMDTDPARRLDRLKMIEPDFSAYPAFNYYAGHAAAELSLDRENAYLNDQDREKLREEAKEYYEKFYQSRSYLLLRSDPIACSNALEYADLLDIDTERDKIEDLLEFAEEYSGREMDILNLCAVGYLKIRDFDHAETLFKWLVNEGYNIDVNSQILSLLYEWEAAGEVSDSTYRRLSLDYHVLESRTEGITLFPLPDKGASAKELLALQDDTVQRQAEIVSNVYADLIAKLQSACTEKINRILPLPIPRQTEEDANYYYSEAGTEDRMEHAKYWLSKKEHGKAYREQLGDINITQQTLDIVNELYITVIRDLNVPAEMSEVLATDIRTALGQANDAFQIAIDILSNQQDAITMADYRQLCGINIKTLTGDFFWHLREWGTKGIQAIHSVTQIIQTEKGLYEFAKSNDLPFSLKKGGLVKVTDLNRLHPFTPEMIGKSVADNAEKYQILNSMIRLIEDRRSDIILQSENANDQVVFCVKGEPEFDKYFNDALRFNLYKKDLRKNALAVIYDHCKLFPADLILTPEYVKYISMRRAASAAPYMDVDISKDGKALQIDNKFFSNRNVMLTSLQNLIAELANYSQELAGGKTITDANAQIDAAKTATLSTAEKAAEVVVTAGSLGVAGLAVGNAMDERYISKL